MTPPDNERTLVELPACDLLTQEGWTVVDATNEVLGVGGTLGRTHRREVVVVPRLREALVKLNPGLSEDGLAQAIDALTRDRSGVSLVTANHELDGLLRGKLKVEVADGRGGRCEVAVRVIDWRNPEANNFLAVRQLTVEGPLYTCRPDIVGFVNGLPWVLIECKATSVSAQRGFEENLTSYKHPINGIPALCRYNAVLIATNGTDGRVGSLTADWSRFARWKRIGSEDEPRRVTLETLIRGVCGRARLVDLVENFTVFTVVPDVGTVKVLGQNHQVLGVNAAMTALRDKPASDQRLGVFWHTQGSGKSLSMLFFAQKVLRVLPGSWTFVVLTDRTELDDQIAATFARSGAVSEAESRSCQATSSAHLRELLAGNHRYVFTLIQKFRCPPGTNHPRLSERSDIIVMADEAHRSQYDGLALNLRAALPKARFLAFTGTPLMGSEEATRQVFGDYVSRYDFQQSVEDEATKPLYYENRTPELRIVNPDLDDDLLDAIEDADLDEDGDRALARALGRNYEVLTRQSRLTTIAKDLVQHFLGLGFQGKAMVVSIDKITALRMHDLVRIAWAEERARVEALLAKLYAVKPEDVKALQDRHQLLVTTDMALVVSPGQNEIEQVNALGVRLGVPLDIEPHRRRMVTDDLQAQFKDPDHPLRIVFVCAMWLTGFDAPSCSTVYLDKPMRNHTLMQTIARANRVWGEDKKCGLIVDYANVFLALEKALAVYGAGSGGERPVEDKTALVEDLREAVDEAVAVAKTHGVDIPAMTPLQGLDRLMALSAAVERLIAPDDVRRSFLAAAKVADGLFKAVLPDRRAEAFQPTVTTLRLIAQTLRDTTANPQDIGEVLARVQRILDAGIETGEIAEGPPKLVNLSTIDFAKLRSQFKDSTQKQTTLETLKAAVVSRLQRMLRINRQRTDMVEKYEAMLTAYNNGSRAIDDLFDALLDFCRELDDEATRHVREHLSEDELAIFDVLTRPDPELTSDERDTVKKVVHLLHQRLTTLLAPGWRERVTARAEVKDQVEAVLDAELPRAYTPAIFQTKAAAVYDHLLRQDGHSAAG